MALVFDTDTRQWYQNAAIADSTGNDAAANEDEVNSIKAALRDGGVLAP